MKLFDVYPQFDIEPIEGLGFYIFDRNGEKYLDFYGGHAVISIGHRHPHYVQRIKEQLNRLGFYSNAVKNEIQVELAAKLGQLSGYPDYDLFLCNSGAEAVENALKLASFHTQKKKIIAFRHGFHGRTSGAVAITDNTRIQAPFNQGHSVVIVDWDDENGLNKALEEGDTAAVIIEGIQGIAGVNVPADQFLKKIETKCQETGTVFILDEIQSGFGRTGMFFAHQYAEVKPDLITVAKGMGNGFPIGGVLIHPKFEARHGLLGTTFGGNHLACVAGLAVLEVLESESLIENASRTGDYLKGILEKHSFVEKVKGRGLMLGIEFKFAVKDLRMAMLSQEKVMTGSASDPNVIRVLPPLTISRDEADEFSQKLESAWSAVKPDTAHVH